MKPLAANYKFEAIGTQWEILTQYPLETKTKQQIANCVEDFDRTYSRFRADSLVSKLEADPTNGIVFPDNINHIYDLYITLEALSGGKINPLVGTRLNELGYGPGYMLEPKSKLSTIPSFVRHSSLKDNRLRLDQPLMLDIGAVGKGLLVDYICKIVADNHSNYIVDGSGDIYVHTENPQTIGLENPFDLSKVIGSVSITHLSICASANNRRVWRDQQHIIDISQDSFRNDCKIVATWAIAPTTLMADALTTGLFFVPPKQLISTFGDFYYVAVDNSGNIAHNINKIGEIFA